MTERNYQTDLEIDGDHLDVENMNQPNRYAYYSDLEAEAKRDLDLAVRKLDRVRAKKALDIRKNPEDYGIDKKPTNEMVNSILDDDDEIEEINQEIIKCRYYYNQLSGAVKAFDHRKSSLKNLTQLYMLNYSGSPAGLSTVSRESAKRGTEQEAKRIVRKHLGRNRRGEE
jgi:hypothetical protein